MKKQKLVDKIIHYLDLLKEEYPETVIILESTDGSADCKIGDANIYENPRYDIVIDAE